MGGFRAPALDRVRIAFIGVGGRGFSHLAQMCVMDGVEITGVCDLKRDLTERGVDRVRKKRGKSLRDIPAVKWSISPCSAS